MKMKLFIVFYTTFAIMSGASATIDSIGRVHIPYSPLHAGDSFERLANRWDRQFASAKMFCFAESMYWDEYSSSNLPTFQRMVMPYEIPVVPGNNPDFQTYQINKLALAKVKVITSWEMFDKYVKEGVDNNIWVNEPEFIIDVTEYDKSTKAGRLEAIVMAKLAIISLHYNLALYGQFFRLNVEVKGLPADQSEFIKEGFTAIKAKTNFPYSGPSPVAQEFYQELISEEFCSRSLDIAKTFAP